MMTFNKLYIYLIHIPINERARLKIIVENMKQSYKF